MEGTQAEQILYQEPPIEDTVEPLTVSIEDIVKKESCSVEHEEVPPLFISVQDIKNEVPELAAEPGCSKWDDQCAPGPSSKFVKDELDNSLPFSKEIKSEPPDPSVKQEMTSSEDGSNFGFSEGDHSQDDHTMSSIKSEPDDFEMKSEEQTELKEEEVMLDDERFQHDSEDTRLAFEDIHKENIITVQNFQTDLVVEEVTKKVNWFQCTHCNFRTAYKRNLTKHLILHKSDKEIRWFQCEHCSFKTKHNDSLKLHSIVHKGNEEINWFQCKHCSYKTKYSKHLNRHLFVHKGDNEITWFQCTHCSYKTKYKCNLQMHLSLHNGEGEGIKWFRCTHCSYKTKYTSHLKTHEIVHKKDDEINWFECTNCSYKTKHKAHLKRHVYGHRHIRRYTKELN